MILKASVANHIPNISIYIPFGDDIDQSNYEIFEQRELLRLISYYIERGCHGGLWVYLWILPRPLTIEMINHIIPRERHAWHRDQDGAHQHEWDIQALLRVYARTCLDHPDHPRPDYMKEILNHPSLEIDYSSFHRIDEFLEEQLELQEMRSMAGSSGYSYDD